MNRTHDAAWLPAGVLAALIACSGGNGPTSPTPPPAPVTLTLSGYVRESGGAAPGISGARVAVVEGVNTGHAAMTNAEGRYTLAGLSPGAFTVEFSHEAFAIVRRPVTLSSDATLDVALDRQAEPRFTLSGSVKTPWNEPIGDVGVEAYHGDRVMGGGTTTSSGAYSIPTLPPLDYVVRPRKWGYESPAIPVHLVADTRLDIVIDRGRVVVEGGVEEAPPCVARAIAGVRVEVVDGPDAGRSTVTPSGGSIGFRLEDIAWGTFRLRASKPGYAASDAAMNIPPPGGAGVVVREFFRLRGTEGMFTLAGEIRAAGTGTPIDDAQVEVVAGPNAGRVTRSGGGLGAGRYELRSLIPGEFRYRVSKPAFQPYEGSNPICGDERRDVQLTPLAPG